MSIFKISKYYFNFYNFFSNYRKNLANNLILKYYFNKKRSNIRNSYFSDKLIKDFFKNDLNFNNLRSVYFNKNIFIYSDKNERKKIIELLKQNCFDEIKKYIEYAETIIRKEFSIFDKRHNFKNKIDWHYSYFEDYQWRKSKESEKINIHPKNKLVDVKYVWELNRHQFFPYLGFAYYISNDEKYAKEFKHLILDWIKENPPFLWN